MKKCYGFLLLPVLAACQPSAPKKPLVVQSQEKLTEISKAPETLPLGRRIYASHCARCHGRNGEGRVGPSLADSAWIYGDGSLHAISLMVHEGAPRKGMPAWKFMLDQKQIDAVSVFTHSLSHKK